MKMIWPIRRSAQPGFDLLILIPPLALNRNQIKMTSSTTDDSPASIPEKSQLDRDIGLALEVKNTAIKNLKNTESDLLERNQELYDDAVFYRKENQKLAAEKQQLQASNQGLQRRYDDIMARFREQNQLADQDRNYLRTEIVRIRNEKAQATTKYNQLHKDYEQLILDYNDLNAECQATQLDFENQQKVIADLRATLQKSQEDVRKYQDYIERQKGFNPQAVMARTKTGDEQPKFEFPVVKTVAGKPVICDATKQPFGTLNSTPKTPRQHTLQTSQTPNTPKNIPLNHDFYRLLQPVSLANSPKVQTSERQLNSTFRPSGTRPRSFSEAYGNQISRLDSGLYNQSNDDSPPRGLIASMKAFDKAMKQKNFLKYG